MPAKDYLNPKPNPPSTKPPPKKNTTSKSHSKLVGGKTRKKKLFKCVYLQKHNEHFYKDKNVIHLYDS
jgi:hypothetical protein